jgi:hypothetical protein
MTSFDPTKFDWTTGLLAGWTYDKEVNKWFQGAFRHAHRLTRPCPTCSETIVLDVTTKALEGNATNHGLALRRCKTCRKALKAGPQAYAVRKAAVADNPAPAPAQAAAPAPQVASAVPPEIMQELETLRTVNATMKEELEGLYMQIKELRDQQRPVETIGFKPPPKPVRTYTLPPEPLTMAESTRRMNAELAARKNNSKMPWEGD